MCRLQGVDPINVIKQMLRKLQCNKVLVCRDELLVPSATMKDGIKLLGKMLVLVRTAGLKYKLQKCSFLKSELAYVRPEVSATGIRLGEQNIGAMVFFRSRKMCMVFVTFWS